MEKERNIKLVIEYDGTDFCGWQYQPDERTVQGEIEDVLKKLLSEQIRITGAGRTDQGVHALGQVANFHTSSTLSIPKMHIALNSLTKSDVNIKQISYTNDDFHSRFSAKSKIYQYNIILYSSPFELRYNWFVKYKLDLNRMEIAKNFLIGKHNFKYLSTEVDKENTVCVLKSISLTEQNSRIIIELEGDRFIRKMVRGIVGFLHDVGRGHYEPAQTQDAIKGKIKNLFFAPPRGLFLIKVKY
ncbi:MAG: tRNA pseudouridine(38-40) synthase TruA [bacterium]